MLRKTVLFSLIWYTGVLSSQINFNRGVNLTNWFQTSNAREIQFTKFGKEDFEDIKSLGCDVIRLPINLHGMTQGAPDYKIDPLFFEFLDKAVDWAEELKINLILDNHSFDPATSTDLNIGTILTKVWRQMAERYKNRTEYILYEILNEPHGITTQQWAAIQKSAIDAIRESDTKHTIIVGASGFNSYSELKNLPVYTDSKLIYTFHFYDPFIFTHQGASWVTPSMVPLAGVPFPYSSAAMPATPASLKGSWIESSLNNYANEGTMAKVKSLIDIAVAFKTSRNVPVFCGEFGVYIPNSSNADRVYWYSEVRKYLEEKGIPWTIWDYTGGFGIFNKGTDELFDHHLNTELLQALNFNVPPQKELIVRADSVGFPIYTDFVEKGFSGGGSGSVTDFYHDIKPNNGKYSLYWANATQYSNISFSFKADKDLSRLVNEGYALDLMVRGNSPGARFDIRFIDSKTADPADRPWRMRVTVDNSLATWDRYWHHLHIPLSSFKEQGAWDNNAWYNPEGKFDWKAVDRLEIVAEHEALTGKIFWFDNIHITNRDTARVMENGIISSTGRVSEKFSVTVYPNPVREHLNIRYETKTPEKVRFQVLSMAGKMVFSDILNLPAGSQHIVWNGSDQQGATLPPGLYLIQLTIGNTGYSYKISVNR